MFTPILSSLTVWSTFKSDANVFSFPLELELKLNVQTHFLKTFSICVHYVCLLVQRFEPQGRRFTNFHYYYFTYYLDRL